MEYFDNENIDEDIRRNIAFQITNAVREVIKIATKSPMPITYERALDYIGDINPDYHRSFTNLLTRKNESDTVKLYKEIAASKSNETIIISPIDLIEEQIKEYRDLLDNSDNPDKKFIRHEISKLKAAKENLMPRKISENKLLEHDFFLVDRTGIFGNIYGEGNTEYKDYSIDDKHVLRLRFAHPDKLEYITGADLIYEQYDLVNEMVRFVHLQYKVWDSNQLYLNDERMNKQFDKMIKNLCSSGFCKGDDNKYRLPYCSGFLRPTSKIQKLDSSLKTTGLHIPICIVKKMAKDGEKKLTKSNIASMSLTSKIFEEMFNANMIGSRWISIDELERFYEEKGLNSLTSEFRIHAQSVRKVIEEELYNK